MLASQLMGTTGVGILLLLSQSLRQPSLVDVALVFSLLGAVATVAFVRWILLGCTRGERQNDVD
jgi:multicomponent Na+:H+ antiporter subunit F